MPKEPGEAQQELGIEKEASYVDSDIPGEVPLVFIYKVNPNYIP
jgi:hypothetical protein